MNLTGNQTYNTSNAGYAAGTLTGLGTQTGVTVAMWVKFSAAALTSNARLFVLGASDVGAVGSVGLTLNGAAKLNVYVDGGSTADTINLGPTLSADTWYFIALTYDGTSSGSTNSTVQGAATTDGNTKNGQLYVGTATSAVTDSPVKIGLTSPNYNDSRGSIDFGASTALYLGNRADYTRGLNGMIDDVSIYSGVLSQTSLDTLRLESVPEPGVAALLAVGVGSLLFFRNRRRVLEDA
ncbi:MAG: LamG domain-containing protein [Verrucomicrobia bacterium]|nr:LamG domain-containing protein [Verrucomicrobiota bacterium]